VQSAGVEHARESIREPGGLRLTVWNLGSEFPTPSPPPTTRPLLHSPPTPIHSPLHHFKGTLRPVLMGSSSTALSEAFSAMRPRSEEGAQGVLGRPGRARGAAAGGAGGWRRGGSGACACRCSKKSLRGSSPAVARPLPSRGSVRECLEAEGGEEGRGAAPAHVSARHVSACRVSACHVSARHCHVSARPGPGTSAGGGVCDLRMGRTGGAAVGEVSARHMGNPVHGRGGGHCAPGVPRLHDPSLSTPTRYVFPRLPLDTPRAPPPSSPSPQRSCRGVPCWVLPGGLPVLHALPALEEEVGTQSAHRGWKSAGPFCVGRVKSLVAEPSRAEPLTSSSDS